MNPTTALTPEPSFLMRLFFMCMPKWLQRAVVLCSFATRYAHVSSDDKEVLHRLNNIFDLVSSEDALKLPMNVSHLVWVDDTIMQPIIESVRSNRDESTLATYAAYVVDRLPKCLRYTERDDMVNDFTQLFTEFPCLSAAH